MLLLFSSRCVIIFKEYLQKMRRRIKGLKGYARGINMKMIYGVKDRPKLPQLLLFSLQQLLAIMAATIAVPMIVGNDLTPAAALFGAGAGTIVYLLFTKFKSPVFLGSSFAFLGSMTTAFAGAATMSLGYLGILLGALFAGLVYVIIAVIVKFAGVKWIDRIMPAVVIGPTVAIIGLSLAGNAVKDFVSDGFFGSYAGFDGNSSAWIMDGHASLCLLCGLVTVAVIIICSVYGKKMFKMIPFVIGIVSGYALAAIFTGISYIDGVSEAFRIIDFSGFKSMQWYPDLAIVSVFGDMGDPSKIGPYIGTVAVAYIPVAFVVFAEHIADHKNISSIIETDLLKDPGLSRTLLGDGVGSIAGALFGGCPNTTYGESVGCVAISGNASVITILVTACMAMLCAFLAPFTTFLSTIPKCVMGGTCITLYGFIAVSGLKMIQKSDLGDNRNLFTVCVILIAGVGGLSLKFGDVVITKVAAALILGIVVNLIVNIKKKKSSDGEQLVMEEVAEGEISLGEESKNEEA